MKKEIVTGNAPAAIGPYSQAIEAGSFVFISGQMPIDPDSGEMAGPTVAEQAHQALKNVRAILRQAGMLMDDVVKTTIYMKDLSGFGTVNEIYGEYFRDTVFPARACVEVARLPKDALIEIEAIAVRH